MECKMFYSNCLIECAKAKIRNPHIKITVLWPWQNEVFCPHFMWSDGEYDYDFGIDCHIPLIRTLWFKGYIRRRNLGFNEKWKANAISTKKKARIEK